MTERSTTTWFARGSIRRSFRFATFLLVMGALAISACGASQPFVGTATSSAGERCPGHLDCSADPSHPMCCNAAREGEPDWQCGGIWPDCPAGECCWVGTDPSLMAGRRWRAKLVAGKVAR